MRPAFFRVFPPVCTFVFRLWIEVYSFVWFLDVVFLFVALLYVVFVRIGSFGRRASSAPLWLIRLRLVVLDGVIFLLESLCCRLS